MIVAVAAGNQPRFTFNPLEAAQTITAYIVARPAKARHPHGGDRLSSPIFAAGLTLFVMTIALTCSGYWLRRRYHQAY